MFLGLKQAETRSWSTKHRGPLAIHASAKPATGTSFTLAMIDDVRSRGVHEVARDLPLGAVLGIVEIVNVVPMTEALIAEVGAQEKRWGIWSIGRFAWTARVVELFEEPIPAKGAQGLWRWDR